MLLVALHFVGTRTVHISHTCGQNERQRPMRIEILVNPESIVAGLCTQESVGRFQIFTPVKSLGQNRNNELSNVFGWRWNDRRPLSQIWTHGEVRDSIEVPFLTKFGQGF